MTATNIDIENKYLNANYKLQSTKRQLKEFANVFGAYNIKYIYQDSAIT